LTEKEAYYKYMDKIFTTAMPQSSIRTRVLSSIRNKKYDFISIEYVPRSGKNKGKIYEQFYKGEKLRLLTWLNDVVEKKNKEFYKKDLQGTFWDGFNLNNLSKEGDTVFESGKKPEELVKKVLEIATKKAPPASKSKLSNNSSSFLTVLPMTFCILLTAISSI
jgi:adenine-specific DNA-methyltransferase